jgi:arylsulfatase
MRRTSRIDPALAALVMLIAAAAHTACASSEAPPSRPNIVFIMADDLGFSDVGPYGSEIATPHLDALAAGGVRFTEFYNAVRCWPSRASLITGQQPHQVGLGGNVRLSNQPLPDAAGPEQGYLSDIATVASRLGEAGYGTYLAGKWHLGERPEHWPRQRGFDRYFGLISGASSYFELIVEPGRPRAMALDDRAWTPSGESFYMTDATVDYALEFLDEHHRARPESPFFLYVAFTAPHWPLHARDEDIARYAGRYDAGWDAVRQQRLDRQHASGLLDGRYALAPRPASVPAWEAVDDRAAWTRRMEVYAAMVDRMDQNIGRLVQALREQGSLDDTLIVFLSDNGASDEDPSGRNLNDPSVPIGARGSYVGYLEPWANVSNTPFRGYKRGTYEGGSRSPFIAHWPRGIAARGLIDHDTVGHIIDLTPTALEAAGVVASGNGAERTEGVSLLSALRGGSGTGRGTVGAADAGRVLFWEHLGARAMRAGQWKLIRPPDEAAAWELYDLATDPTELHDLASSEPARLEAMAQEWTAWARRVGARE